MERRFLFALLLTGPVMLLTPVVFPRRTASPPPTARVDSSIAVVGGDKGAAPAAAAARSARGEMTRASAAESVSVLAGMSSYLFTTMGAVPLAVRVDSYPALNGQGGRVVLRHGREPLIRFRVLAAGRNAALHRILYRAVRGTS